MTWNRLAFLSSAVLVAMLILAPSTASAQAIAGTVSDDTGGVLPGVTVEATSPALIEGVRTAFSDGAGLYNIANLEPGTYSVTFTLPGFSTIIREGVVLTAGFSANIDAAMQVGGIEETITVTGASPLVDVQTTTAQTNVSTELLKSLPSGGGFAAQSLITLVPGVTGTADVGGSSGLYRSNGQSGALFFHGKSDNVVLYDGMGMAAVNGSSIPYVLNSEFASETVMETGGGNAESNSTLLSNMIPREGGNEFSFRTAGTYTNDGLQADNLDQELRDQGVEFTNDLLKFYNFDMTVGGPIKRDKVWFFAATRAARNKNLVPNTWFNDGIGTPFYVPDLNRPGYRTEWMRSGGGRVTVQATPRNKISGFIDAQGFFNRGRGEFASPEAYQSQYNLSPEQLYQANWTSPLSNRLLLEAGFSHMRGRWPYPSPGDGEFASVPGAIAIRELTTGYRYNARASYSDVTDQYRFTERVAASYVTGSHAVKVGFMWEQGVNDADSQRHGDVNYDFRNGLPSRITQYATYAPPSLRKVRTSDLGVFAQDQWTLDRMTMNLGVRFDRFTGNNPAQSLAATAFVPARDYAASGNVVDFTDLQPRLGLSYDLKGNGQTALKFAVGRYVETRLGNLVQRLNAISTSVNNARRNWNDANGDFIPDCDLTSSAANGECGSISDNNFGQINPGATVYSDEVTQGFSNRNFVWDMSAEVVQELAPGVSLTAGYYRNWAGNWNVNDNVAIGPDDFDTFCATAPMDSRLPNGGGYEVCGLYDISKAARGQGTTLVQSADSFIGSTSGVTCGAQRDSNGTAPDAGSNCGTNDFIGVSIDTRFTNGAQLGGGFDTGRSVINTCFVVDSPQAMLNCDTEIPWKAHHNVKFFGSYPLPADIQVSFTFQSVAGQHYEANYSVPNNDISASLGRNLSACSNATGSCNSTVTIPLIAPYTQFLDRRNQLDLRFGKGITIGGARLRGNLDLYNVTNGNQVLGGNSTFGPSWLFPSGQQTNGGVDAILPGRVLHLSGSLDF